MIKAHSPSRLTTLDIMLAAHLLVILKPPFPDTLLSDLLTDSYPTLVSHAERIMEMASQVPTPLHSSPQGPSIRSLFPSLIGGSNHEHGEQSEEYSEERVRWGWASLAVGSVGLYLMTQL